MNNKIVLAGVAALALGLVIGTTAFAYQGDVSKKGPNYTPEREAKIELAIKSGNFDTWKNLMIPGSRVAEVVTKDNFQKFATMWTLEHSGKYAEAAAIRAELGLGAGQGMHRVDGSGISMGQMRGSGRGMHRNLQK